MQIGVIGLGRMGGNISRRLMKAGHQCVVFDVDTKAREALAKDGAYSGSVDCRFGEETRRKAAGDLADVACLARLTEEMVEQLSGLLDRDDIIIDGGNSFYKDDIRNAKKLWR